MYASALLEQRFLTRARRVLDRALRALPVTQHHRVWPLLRRLAYLPGCPAPTAVSVLRRYLQFDSAHAEDDGFCSAKGTTKQQLLLDLCELLAKHPDDVAGMPVEAILCSAARKFSEEAGVWTTLAGYYARKGIHHKARDVFEEGAATATSVKDFRLVFDSYMHFEQAVVAAELDRDAQEENSAPVLQGF
jgi:pre-mRNA-splicing factor SYF1